MTTTWQKVWRDGVVPLVTREQLQALKDALIRDDCRLVQGVTTTPPPLMCVQDWPVEAACLLGYMAAVKLGGFACDWGPDGTMVLPRRDGAATVGAVETEFARMCFAIDDQMNEPAACRYLLNPYDEWPRAEMRANLLPEVNLALAQKGPCDDPGRAIP